MTNTDYVVQERNGLRYVTPAWSSKRKETHFNVFDVVLVLGFLAATTGLVYLLTQ
jgi:hypothetical protein